MEFSRDLEGFSDEIYHVEQTFTIASVVGTKALERLISVEGEVVVMVQVQESKKKHEQFF